MMPWVLSGLLLVLHFLTGYGRRRVWLLWMANDLLWIGYSIIGHQEGFLLSAVPLLLIHARNYMLRQGVDKRTSYSVS